jgi:hypothetical protein
MTSQEYYELIQKEDLVGIPPADVTRLFKMSRSDYDDLVRKLLEDDGDYLKERGDYHYSDLYRCQIYGCVLFTIRPNPDLYEHVLAASLKIGDPSSCCDAVVALLQVKSPPEVAIDLLRLIDHYSLEDNADEMHCRIMGMFYWLGTSPKGLTRNNAWPGYATWVDYEILFNKTLLYPDEEGPETEKPLTPAADPVQAEQVSLMILEKMLDLFEENNANQTARSIIAGLPMPDAEYLQPYRDRIIRAFVSANSSSDEYVRQRVSDSRHQHFIRST